MSQIKKFMDKIVLTEGRNAKEVVMTLSDAKLLRDEIMTLLLEQKAPAKKEEVIEVVARGGKW
jgi:hypothetical protein